MTEIHDRAHDWFSSQWDPTMTLGEWWALLGTSGWGYPHWPEHRFGQGLDHHGHMEVERAREDVGAFGVPNDVGVTLVAPTLFAHGPEALLDRYLEAIATGQELWCQLFSEPGSGSDLAGLTTTAERDGDRFIVNGSKVWTTGGHLSQRAVLMARTDPSVAKHAGISFFAIDLDQPGVEVHPLRDMTGDSEFNQVFLTDAEVAVDDVIGELGDGWRVANTMLQVERDLDATGHDGGGDVINAFDLTMNVGDAQAQMADEASAGSMSGFGYATGSIKDRVTTELIALARDGVGSGGTVLRDQQTRAAITRRVLDLNANRGLHASIGKLLNSSLCRELRDLGFAGGTMAAQLGRADALDGGHFLKSALFTQGMAIAGGTDEIQRNILGERALGLPREPDATKGLPFREIPRNETSRTSS